MKQARTVATTIRLTVPVWRRLRRLAEDEALRAGGRASTAATVARLVIEAAQRRATEPPEAA